MSSKYIQTEGIVLKRINYKDSDKIITIYTKDLGKISCTAKGIRKVNSRKKSHLELLNLTNIYIVESHGRYIITQAQSTSTFQNIKKDLQSTQMAYYILEIFEKLIPEHEANLNLFRFITKTIEYLNIQTSPNILNAFNIKLLRILGFYNRSEIQQLPKNMKEYINRLETSEYKDIINIEEDYEVTKNTHLFLRDYTEGVLERQIKTQVTLIEPNLFV
ncbi:DNA repair protein RecO [candidate division WWE3 bacterium CG_4_9_14_3_um_filter_34_6]|uniref:DNA repair protein RecO n=1 Tax=candidate division WWE3 bacterium CG_4_9_14_3_um_filter_34_6 TaxID=1975079 RepID=A0A2M7X4Y1_UNCKA|nr:MAG: DNA repair protein RecO [candidate division WWE3 bacterium CG_4_9_14_3_um_filter_34_6]